MQRWAQRLVVLLQSLLLVPSPLAPSWKPPPPLLLLLLVVVVVMRTLWRQASSVSDHLR